MKIESVDVFPMAIKANENLTGGTFRYSSFQTVLVKVDVEGVIGWGEAMTRFDPGATAMLVRYLAKEVIGRAFESPADVWDILWRMLRVRGHTRGTDVEALSGLEIGVYDAVGKIRSKRVAELLSARPSVDVPVFAGSLFESRGPIEKQIAIAKEAGLLGAKVKVGFGVQADKQTLVKARKHWDDGMLVADANGAYDAANAKKACRAFREIQLEWFEEPVPSDDVGGYQSLRREGVKIGAGESLFYGDFERFIGEGLLDVLEPSVSRCGGIGVEIEAAKSAAERGIKFSPMTGMNSEVSLAASLQVAASVKTLGVEFNPFNNPLQRDLASGLGDPKDGKLRLPGGPGLGIEVDERYVRSHSYKKRSDA